MKQSTRHKESGARAMTMRKWLLSTVISGSVFLVSAGTAMTAAAAGKIVQPSSNWAVSKISSSSSDAGAYCALARRYSPNMILTLAQNSTGEGSVAIDFQKEILDKTQSYRVTFVPGAGETRTFDVKPVSGKAVVVRLGKDRAFYNALDGSGGLDVSIADVQYNFRMPDFTNGMEQLSGCLASISEPAAGGDRPASVSPSAPVQAKAAPAVSHNTVRLAKEIESLQEENTRLKNALERERRAFENQFMQQADTSSAVAELNEKISILENENGVMKERLASAPEMPAAPVAPVESCEAPAPLQTNTNDEVVQSMTRELTTLRAENAGLQQQLKEIGSVQKVQTNSPLPAIEAQLREAEMRAEKAEKDLADTRESLAREIAGLREELRVAKVSDSAQAPQIESGLQEAEARATKAERTLKDLQTESAARIANLREELRMARLETQAVIEKQIATDSPAVDQKSLATIARLRGEVDRLMDENTSLKDSLQKREAELASARSAAPAMTPVPEPVAAAKVDNGITIAQLRSIESQLSVVQAERDRLAAELDAALQDKEDKMMSRVASVGDRPGLSPTIAGNNWDLEQATRRYNEAEREIRRLGVQLEKHRAQCATEKREIEYMLFDPEIASQEQISKLMRLEEAAANVDAQLEAQAEKYQAKISSLEDKLADATTRLAVYKTSGSDGSFKQAAIRQEQKELAYSLANISTAAGNATAPMINRGLAVPKAGETIKAEPLPPVGSAKAEQNIIPVPSISFSGDFITGQDVEAILTNAQITLKEPVSAVKKAPGTKEVAFKWQSGGLFGSAEQKPIGSAAAFDGAVQQYLDKTGSRCAGEFAAVPAADQNSGSIRVSAYEIACVGDAASAAASVVFFSQNNLFTTIAHEGSIESMDVAMDVRDRLVADLMQTQIASR